MIRDLLNPSSGFLELREDGRGVVVAGISEVQAKKTSEVSMESFRSPQTCFCCTITVHFTFHFKRFYCNSCHGTFDACLTKKGFTCNSALCMCTSHMYPGAITCVKHRIQILAIHPVCPPVLCPSIHLSDSQSVSQSVSQSFIVK